MTALGGDLVREARRRAGLTQTVLAERAGTTQSGIARWESGRTAISLDDVIRLLRLCGFDLDLMLVPHDSSDLLDAEQLRGLSVEARMMRQKQMRDLMGRLHRDRTPA